MKPKILKLNMFVLLAILIGAGCDKNEIPDDTRKAEDYIGQYSGEITRELMAPDGFIKWENPMIKKIPTDIEITQSDKGSNYLMVYVSAYNDSILCEFDESTGYIWILNEIYSFYLRTSDFPEFDGIFDHAVSTYGLMGNWQHTDTIFFSINFLKNINDSIFLCETKTKRL